MDIKKCEKCIDFTNCDTVENTICEVCLSIDMKGNGENKYFLELDKDTPECCGKCNFRNRYNSDDYCEGARYFNTDDRHITYPYIRKNYLSKGKPKFCPYRKLKEKK